MMTERTHRLQHQKMTIGRTSLPSPLLPSLASVVFYVLCCLVCLGPEVRGGPLAQNGADSNSIGFNVLDTPIVAIGRCRVQCMKKNPIPTTSGRSKAKQNHFRECWKMCENRYRNPKVFEPLCSGKYCSSGCQTACAFWNITPSVEKAASQNKTTWTFPDDVKTDTDFVFIEMEWPRPLPQPQVTEPHPIIYTLLMRENNNAWQLIGQTFEERYVMDYDEAALVPEFLIQAIDETGLIADTIFIVDEIIFTDVLTPVSEFGALADVSPRDPDQNTANLTYSLIYEKDEGLQVRLNWTHPLALLGVGGWEKTVYYELVYILDECGVYDDLPKCRYPDDLFSVIIPFSRNEKPHFTIDNNLFFNTRYHIRLELANKPLGELGSFILDTPRCESPSDDFRHCHQLNSDVTTPTSANVTDQQRPLTKLIRDVTIELVFEEHPHDDDTVLVNVSWAYISDLRNVNFSITIFTMDNDDGMKVDTFDIPGETYFIARLQDNTVYEVLIELVAPPEEGDLKPTARNILDDSRHEFNTSTLDFAIQSPSTLSMTKDPLKAVSGVIIGLTCLAVLVFVACTVLFLYKKRQSFKGIIIPKTTVAKSNSYKSSVGGKTDYSNQLMVFCDEWELDPQKLKFSTPLGQGAFGKVVTGYYSDHKVAIKLVKEGAPLSYREDLLAEINLVKRLGTHPNIVCLVGACTISDPIALVMEYVPYGNLQNFLKKCRMEGDLQKRANGPSEIQYSMLQDCGGIENGVITPTDMLSFARQVAMAMEYLAEKKYVHRDLAARNILLHYDKVVKVCDFGLSRDIFNADNQYKKLTNGKLPLKWMAIESLRDRVFTTQSDVWSFGILLWEIVTMGASPYPCIALADLYYVLSNHYRMDRPSNCSNELYAMMRACWAERPQDRPSFTELRLQLEDLMAEDRDYPVLEDIDLPLSASESSSNPTAPELFSGELMPCQSARKAVSVSSSSGSGSSASASASVLLRQGPPYPPSAVRRPPMTIDVCIHQKSTERLMRPSESDSSP